MTYRQNGFTIPELVISLSLSSFFVILLLTFTFSYWKAGYLQEADLTTLVARLNAGDSLRESFNSSSGLISQNSIPDSHTHNPDPAIGSNLYWTPLHAVPGNKPVGTSGTQALLYYKRPSLTASGDFIMNG